MNDALQEINVCFKIVSIFIVLNRCCGDDVLRNVNVESSVASIIHTEFDPKVQYGEWCR